MPILVKIHGLSGHGDATLVGYADGDWFNAQSFSFGVEREMKKSGRKGGTQDINIGVGELQECTISKSIDAAPAAERSSAGTTSSRNGGTATGWSPCRRPAEAPGPLPVSPSGWCAAVRRA